MPYLILVRHSVPQQNPKIVAREWPLSPEGRERCRQLGQQLATTFNPAFIATSDEPKAIETAKIIAEFFALPVQVQPDLHEHERRNVGYLPANEFKARIAAFFAYPDELILGEETANQALVRFEQAIRNLLARPATGDVLAVTHGTVMTLFLSRYNPELNPFEFWQQLSLPAVYVLSLPDFRIQTVS